MESRKRAVGESTVGGRRYTVSAKSYTGKPCHAITEVTSDK